MIAQDDYKETKFFKVNKIAEMERELQVINSRNMILASNLEQKDLRLNYLNIELNSKTKELEKFKHKNEEILQQNIKMGCDI